jgi:hypothetical protein
MKPYWIALVRGNYDGYAHRPDTLVMQMRHDIDYLSCEAYVVVGPRYMTKTSARNGRAGLLDLFNQKYGWDFKHLIVD